VKVALFSDAAVVVSSALLSTALVSADADVLSAVFADEQPTNIIVAKTPSK